MKDGRKEEKKKKKKKPAIRAHQGQRGGDRGLGVGLVELRLASSGLARPVDIAMGSARANANGNTTKSNIDIPAVMA